MTKPLHADDPILGPARGSIYTAHRFAMNVGSLLPRDVERYLDEVYRLAPLVGIDPAIVVAQSALEADNWRSEAWVKRRNPAGIGILGDPGKKSEDLGYSWADGTQAARGQIVHLWQYTSADFSLPAELFPYQSLDYRLGALRQSGWAGTVRTIQDLSGKWATVPDYGARIAKRGNELFGFQEATPVTITFGKVPHPTFQDRPISKPAGFGQDNLGTRQPKFVVLHRMVGSLTGTDGYFRLPDVGALTDYGVGVAAQDGAALAGTIYRWNDPRGIQSGWASGPVNGAYGDGAAIVAKYGIDAVNRDGVSIEISGQYATPVDAKATESVAALMAYWWDQMKIPHTSAPINPATGISAVIWHREFTLGTGKICPGQVVMDATDALIVRATAILKQYQEGSSVPTPTISYPEGMDAGIAMSLFGKVTKGTTVYAFNPDGAVSQLWLEEGARTGVYPTLVGVDTFDTRTYFRFASGLVIWTPSKTAPVRILKAA